MFNPYSKSATIKKAVHLLSGQRFREIYSICETQKTVSTKKLYELVEELREADRLDAIHFRELADKTTD